MDFTEVLEALSDKMVKETMQNTFKSWYARCPEDLKAETSKDAALGFFLAGWDAMAQLVVDNVSVFMVRKAYAEKPTTPEEKADLQ